MNQLNNQQVVLLTILVSFVTSIATGIFTVSLLDQAPPAVTTTLDRVVNRTVEIIKPTETETIIRETTVIDRNGESVVSAIKSTANTLVEIGIKKNESDTSTTTPLFTSISIGFFIDENGSILALSNNLPENEIFYAKNSSNKLIKLNTIKKSDEYDLALFVPVEKEKNVTYLSMSKNSPATGQTAIVLHPKEVAVTFISQITNNTALDTFYKLYFESNGDISGRPVIDINGKVIGILKADNSVIPIDKIKKFLNKSEESNIEDPTLLGNASEGNI